MHLVHNGTEAVRGKIELVYKNKGRNVISGKQAP